jgi:hypothetical protein
MEKVEIRKKGILDHFILFESGLRWIQSKRSSVVSIMHCSNG